MNLSTEALARASSRRPWRTIGLWVLAIVVAFVAIALLLGPNLTSEQELTNNPESYRANELVARHFPNPDETDEVVVVRSERYTVDDPEFRAFVTDVFERGRATGAVVGARTYYQTRDRTLVSRDRHATLIPIRLGEDAETGIEKVIDVVLAADRRPAFSAAITGEWTIDRDFNELAQSDLKEGELYFGAPAALLVLLLVFGTVVAAGLPLLLAIVSIIVALGLTALVAAVSDLSVFVINMLTAVGLALGIDYALFVLSRYREERARGASKDEAIATAGATSSRAVLFSGGTFVVALVGLLLVPDNIMRSLAVGAILVGIVSVVAALTLLPAVLGLLGDRVNALRVPFIGLAVASGDREARFWGQAARGVMRYPVASLVLSAGLLIAAATPVIDLKTGFPSVSTFPDSFVSKRGLDALQRNFRGGQADPVRIVVRGDARSADVRGAVDRLRDRLAQDRRYGRTAARTSPDGELVVVTTALPGAASDPVATRALRDIRSEHVPAAFAGVDATVLVGGETAQDVDYFDTMDYWRPIVFAFVLGLSFLLLVVVFRSIVVPLKAMLLNLLSVGVAYGLIVLVFEKGFLADFFGFRQVENVVAWVPLFLFCVLFGLSMDYHVFLLSRIRERFVATGDNAGAVLEGVATTARMITGAALIIIMVFIGFASGELVMFQQMGFGVAVALLVDATIVRSVLVPASMKLLGRWNWYLPSWLGWLPRLQIEGERAPAAPPVQQT